MVFLYTAEMTSFGSEADNKHIKKSSVSLEGNAGAGWVAIPSDEYRLKNKTGVIVQRLVDDNSDLVDWDDYAAYQDLGNTAFRATYTVTAGGTETTYTNEALTFAYADPSFRGDGLDGESVVNPLVFDTDIANGGITSIKIAATIQSDNFSTGVAGWQITRDTGDAEFNDVTVRGTIYATVGAIGGFTIGASTISVADFSLDSTNKKMVLGSGTDVITLDAADATYRLAIGHSTYASAPFRVTKAGAVTATSGTVGGWTLGSSSLTGGNATLANTGILTLGTGTDVVILDAADATYRLAIGHSTYASAPFRVTKAGAVTASSIDLAGGSVSGTFTVSGTLRSAASPNARYELTGAGFKTYDSGNTQRAQILNDGSGWLGDSSKFSWTSGGVLSVNGSIVTANTLDADKVTFSAPTISGLTLTDNSPGAGSVAWSSFKLTYQGTTYTVSAGNTSSKYIYWKKATSTTVLQTAASIPSIAADTFLVVVNSSGTAIQSNFAPFIYADYISVSNLSAISADLGTITAGTVTSATIRTASAGARTEMNATNLFGLGFGGIGGYNGSAAQWYAKASDGKLYAGGGDVVIDADGITVSVGTSIAIQNKYKLTYSGTEIGYLSGYYDSGTARRLKLFTSDATDVKDKSIEVKSAADSTKVAYTYITAESTGYSAQLTLFADATNNVASITASADLLALNTTIDIGSGASPFGNGYFDTIVYVNDNSNANMTKGITIKQASNDEIIAFKRNTLAHGMTNLSETDTYGTVTPAQTTNGGIGIHGYSASTIGARIDGYITTGNTARATTAVGAVVINGELKSGSGSGALSTNHNILVVRDADATRFLVDKEGDIHMDATSNINAWDDHDDVALLEAYRVKTANPNFKHQFAQDIEKSAQILSETGVLTLNDDGHHFVSMKGLMGLTIDAIRQMNMRLQVYERALISLGVDVKQLRA